MGEMNIKTLGMEAYWDQALSRSLTPDGEKADEREDVRLAVFVEKCMIPELYFISTRPCFIDGPRRIEVLGPGLLEDICRWIILSEILKFSMSMTDCSGVSCRIAEDFLNKHGLLSVVRHLEVFRGWDSGEISDDEAILYYGGRFIQNQTPTMKDAMLEHLGRFLRLETERGVLGRRVYFLHPLGEDNTGRQKWRNTIPYTEAELRAPLEKGFGGHVLIEVVAKHDYFSHYRYSFIRISAV